MTPDLLHCPGCDGTEWLTTSIREVLVDPDPKVGTRPGRYLGERLACARCGSTLDTRAPQEPA